MDLKDIEVGQVYRCGVPGQVRKKDRYKARVLGKSYYRDEYGAIRSDIGGKVRGKHEGVLIMRMVEHGDKDIETYRDVIPASYVLETWDNWKQRLKNTFPGY